MFCAPLVFAQRRCELVLDPGFLELPIFLADPGMRQALEQHAQQLLDRLFSSRVLSNRVAMLLGRWITRGEPLGVDLVARHLGMSTRSLQGKRKAEGGSYQKLFDTVREKLALAYLKKPDTAVCEVAFLLGYSDQSAFNHAFKRWTGKSPQQFRRS